MDRSAWGLRDLQSQVYGPRSTKYENLSPYLLPPVKFCPVFSYVVYICFVEVSDKGHMLGARVQINATLVPGFSICRLWRFYHARLLHRVFVSRCMAAPLGLPRACNEVALSAEVGRLQESKIHCRRRTTSVMSCCVADVSRSTQQVAVQQLMTKCRS